MSDQVRKRFTAEIRRRSDYEQNYGLFLPEDMVKAWDEGRAQGRAEMLADVCAWLRADAGRISMFDEETIAEQIEARFGTRAKSED